MKPIKDRTVWVHVNVPGQGAGAADLPAELALPTITISSMTQTRRLDHSAYRACPGVLGVTGQPRPPDQSDF